MLNLLKADLYRITRPRGLRGSIWQYGIALLLVYVFIFAVFWLLNSPGVLYGTGGQGFNSPDFSSNIAFTSPTNCLSEMMLGIVPLCVTFMTAELALSDFKNGFATSVISARRGRLSYFAEKILAAGMISALSIMATSVLVLAGAFVVGATFTQGETLASVAAWFLGAWLNCWALSALTLVLVYGTRVSPVSYIGAFCFCTSMVPQTLLALAASSGGVLRFLEPIAPALETLATWMPSSALGTLEQGGASIINAQVDLFEATSRAVAINPTAQVILTGVIWIVLASLAILAIARHRDI